MPPPAAGTAAPVDPYDLGRAGIEALLDDQPTYRARQVWAWLLKGVEAPEEMTDLPAGLRTRLAASFAPAEVVRHTTADGGLTHKILLRSGAGGRAAEAVESVLMLYPREGQRRHARATVCVSTQAGCAMACPFCATGQAGLRRQLTAGEVVRQVTTMQRLLSEQGGSGPPLLAGGSQGGSGPPLVAGGSQGGSGPPLVAGGSQGGSGPPLVAGLPDHVTNVVFMGMGEPLANLDVTVEAVRWLHDPEGFGLSARSITVSTVGLVPGIRRLAALGLPLTLAVSLHAPNDELRDDLVPVNRQFPLATLLAACRDYVGATGRRLTFEYVLIAGVNDGLDHAAELADLARGLGEGSGPPAHVNLIPMNPTPGIDWRAPSPARRRAFRDVLTARGVAATLRDTRGSDIDAACGQLYADYALASGRMLPAAARAWRRWEGLPVPGSGS